jgi:hypothetical protein
MHLRLAVARELARPNVSVNAQTHMLAGSIMVLRREVRRLLRSQIQLSSPNEVNNGNTLVVLLVLRLPGGGAWGYSRWRG